MAFPPSCLAWRWNRLSYFVRPGESGAEQNAVALPQSGAPGDTRHLCGRLARSSGLLQTDSRQRWHRRSSPTKRSPGKAAPGSGGWACPRQARPAPGARPSPPRRPRARGPRSRTRAGCSCCPAAQRWSGGRGAPPERRRAEAGPPRRTAGERRPIGAAAGAGRLDPSGGAPGGRAAPGSPESPPPPWWTWTRSAAPLTRAPTWGRC